MKKRLKVMGEFLLCLSVVLSSITINYVLNGKLITSLTGSRLGKVVVDEDEIADYSVFLYCGDKYGVLKNISSHIRQDMADYMKTNNLKIEEGEYTFHIKEKDVEDLLEHFELVPINE